MPYSQLMKPVTLPPGRARLSAKPAPTGSPNTGDTIGTVRVTCSNALTVEAPWARMTSGARAASSAACLRIAAALLVAQRVSTRTFWPMLQPACCNPCRNAPNHAWNSASSAVEAMMTPIRRMRSGCWARTAAGQAVARPATALMNSRLRTAAPSNATSYLQKTAFRKTNAARRARYPAPAAAPRRSPRSTSRTAARRSSP